MKLFLQKHIVIVLFIIGILLRVVYLGDIPGKGAVNPDEAYAGYEAYSLLHYGTDSHGYSMPVYLEAWGSGMNALETYCMIPFIALLGLNAFSIRCAQCFWGILALIASYFLAKSVYNKKIAVISLGLMTFMPWQLMMCRWGLESNMLPDFLLFGLLFLVKATKNAKWIFLSMICYGLALYCYASIWIVMPFVVFGTLAYLIFVKKLNFDKNVFLSAIVLFLFSVPLLLFVMVNLGYIDCIKTRYISIPLLTVFRNQDVSFHVKDICSHIYTTWKLLYTQNDGILWNSPELFGIYYLFSNIFIIIGIIVSVTDFKKDSEKHCLEPVIWIQFGAAVVLGALISSNVNRINAIHVPMIFFCAVGIMWVKNKFGKTIFDGIIFLYAVTAIAFCCYYVSDYNDQMAVTYKNGLGAALQYANQNTGDHIHVLNIEYPLILYYTKFPTSEYVNSVEYQDPKAAFLKPDHFGKYILSDCTQDSVVQNDIYLCLKSDEATVIYMQENDMEMHEFDNCIVGIPYKK